MDKFSVRFNAVSKVLVGGDHYTAAFQRLHRV